MVALLFPGHGSQSTAMGIKAYMEIKRKAEVLLERAKSFSGIDVFESHLQTMMKRFSISRATSIALL